MNAKTTAGLGWITLLALLGALWLMFGEDPTKDPGARGARLFEGLEGRVADIARLTLTDADQSVTLVRSGEDWAVAERGGYPADAARVAAMVRGLVRAERREPKTTNQARFPAVGLGPEATRLTLLDGAGQEIASLDVGRHRSIAQGRSLTYVFKPADSRAWVVSALTAVEAGPASWLKPGLVSLDAERFSEIVLADDVKLIRLGDGMTLDGLREGEKLKTGFKLEEPGRILARLGFEDVRDIANPLQEPRRTLTARTGDGLVITVTLYELEGETWYQLGASFDASVRDAEGAAVLGDGEADGAGEAARLSARADGFLFKLARADGDVLTRPRSGFVDQLITPAEEAATN